MKLLFISALYITLLSCNEEQNQSDPSITDTTNTDIAVADTFGTSPIPSESLQKVEPALVDTTPKLSCEFVKGKWKATIIGNADAESYHENIDLECYDGYKLRLKSGFQSLLAFQGEAVGSLNLVKSRNVRNETTELFLERQGDVIVGSLTRNISGDGNRYSVMLERE